MERRALAACTGLALRGGVVSRDELVILTLGARRFCCSCARGFLAVAGVARDVVPYVSRLSVPERSHTCATIQP
jgi:hypothetical protein